MKPLSLVRILLLFSDADKRDKVSFIEIKTLLK